MYAATGAMGVRFGINKKWETITLADWNVADLFVAFRRVQVTLTLANNSTPLYLDLNLLKTQWGSYAGRLSALLTANGNTALPTTTSGIALNKRSAKFRDIFKAGFDITPVTHANVASSQITDENKPDVRLTRTNPVVDYMHFFQHCLVTVNGFYHLADTDGINGIVVSDAFKSLLHSGQNQMGMLSFTNVCSIRCVPLLDSMIQQTVTGEARINLPSNLYDLTNKTVLASIGGYLHTVDGTTLIRTSLNDYKINFNGLPLLDRFFESRKFINLSSLPLESTPLNLDQISLEALTSDEFILAYLKLSQTFFIILDCPEIFIEKQYIKRTGIPDTYLCSTEPLYPLVFGLGRHPEYWSVLEDGYYSVKVYDNIVENKQFNTTLREYLSTVDGANWPHYPGYISDAHFLEIGRET